MMDFEEWEPKYEAILNDFKFERYRDVECARILDNLIDSRHIDGILQELDRTIHNQVVAVIGAKFEQLSADVDTIIAADSSTSMLLAQDIFPDIIVTDLDGDLDILRTANDQGTILVVHAHGDNTDKIQRWVPEFRGKIIGTTQAKPFGSLHNFGGFTDGDRAVFLAHHFQAKRVLLSGFDFSNPVAKEGTDPAVKKRKLEWAERLIQELAHVVLIDYI
jgi:uncharacterized Rossmann fold enzyme